MNLIQQQRRIKMAELNTLRDLAEHLAQDMLYAENAIYNKGLPKMIKAASDPQLKDGFEQHREETQDQIEKLKKAMEMMDFDQEREKCDAIEGLLEEGEHLIKDSSEGPTRDAALIAAAQKVEHYEIASYGALCNMAKLLGENEAAELLHEILEQEKATDEKLSELCDNIEEQAMEKAA
jgi:ferritin-like metal-binding protein YciE